MTFKAFNQRLVRSFISEEVEGEWTDDDGNLHPPERAADNMYADRLLWTVAEGYDIVNDVVEVKEVGEPRVYDPLEDPDLLSSFLWIGGSYREFEKRLLLWVSKYGLPRRKSYKIEDGDAPPNVPFIGPQAGYGGAEGLDQAPISVDEFRMEVREARSAAELYHHLYNEDLYALTEWVRRLNEEQKDRILNQVEKVLLPDGKVPPGPSETLDHNWVLGIVAGFQIFVRGKVSKVRLSISPASIWPFPQERYTPRRSYRCSDLLSAIWLMVYLAITERHPLRRCRNQNCGNLFFPTRRDRWSCCDHCRWNSRPSRQKSADV